MSPYPPLEALRLHPDESQKVPIPDRAAGHPIVLADPLAVQIGRGPYRTVFAHIKVACSEVAQREDRQSHMAPVALVDTAEMPRHRRLAALHLRILERAPQHFGAHLPRSAVAV